MMTCLLPLILQYAKRSIITACAVIALSSCHHPHDGFTQYEGIYWQLLKFGDIDKPCHAGNYITADIIYMNMSDSVFFSGVRKFRVGQPDFFGSVNHCFLRMKEHDSAVFIIPTDDFFQKNIKNAHSKSSAQSQRNENSGVPVCHPNRR